MPQPVRSLLIYEYPSLAGPPLGTYEPDEAVLESPEACQMLAACVGILAHSQDDGTLLIVGQVFRYESKETPEPLHVLADAHGTAIRLQRDEVATQLLRDRRYFCEVHAAEPWIDFMDVLLWFQYESNIRLAFLADRLARTFLPPQDEMRVFMQCQMLVTAIERNRRQARQAARRAFRKALPDLLPGLQIAKKKPGYGWNKGHADFFLSQQAELYPTQLLYEPVSQTCVESLRQAIQGYHSPRGYLIAPGLDAEVVLDDTMVFVPFGDRRSWDGAP